jgi:thiol-disulfide isomerase/thioredoxin
VAGTDGAADKQKVSSSRYRGWRGALAFLVFCALTSIPVAIVIGALIGYMASSRALAEHVALRMLLLGVITGLACGAGRLICGGAWQRLDSIGSVRGDWGALLGFLAAMLIVGYAARPFAVQRKDDKLAVGRPVEIAGPTLDGKHFDLADCRGKVVLVDFWATWCGPCVAELPNVKEVYDRYHSRGLEIVGVSLDQEPDALRKFTRAEDIPWPQIFFDEAGKRGWDNPIGVKYHVEGIPFMLIVDQEGKLVDYDVRGHEIEPIVARLLGGMSAGAKTLSVGQDLVLRLLYAILQAPVWLVVVSALGGALVGAALEAVVYRAKVVG